MFSKINIIMANPEGAKAREPYQNLDADDLSSESIKSLPTIGEDLGVVRSLPGQEGW